MPHRPGVWIVAALANPIVGIALVIAPLIVLMLGLKFYRDRHSAHPELLRKCVHIGMGLVTLSFPWLFHEVWPVLVLAGSAAVLLLSIKAVGPMRKLMGGVVDGVERQSYGEIYFPAAVAVLFWLSQGNWLLYCVPILLLTLGDAVAALVGVRYGSVKYSTDEGQKSAEGSLAFFIVGFLCTLVPLLLFTQTGRTQTLLIPLIIGLLATILEAIAWRGLDNLFLPLGGYLLLKTHLGMSLPTLIAHFVVTLALVIFVVIWRRRTTLNDSAVLGAALYGYCVWSIGGIAWLFAPVFLFVAYPLVWPRTSRDADRTHTINVVTCVGAAGLFWLFVAVAFHVPALVFVYNVAFGAQMAMIGLARLRHRYSHTSGAFLLPLSVIGSWILLVLPPLLVETPPPLMPARAAAAFAALTISAIAFDRLRRDLRNYPCDPARWRLQAALGMVGSALGLAPLLWGL